MPASRLAALTPICFKASSFAASTSLAAWLAASSALVSIRRRASSTALWKLLMDKPIVAFTADSPRVVIETKVSAHCRTAPSVGAAEAGAEAGGDVPEADEDEEAHAREMGDSKPDAAVDDASVKMPPSNDASRSSSPPFSCVACVGDVGSREVEHRWQVVAVFTFLYVHDGQDGSHPGRVTSPKKE